MKLALAALLAALSASCDPAAPSTAPPGPGALVASAFPAEASERPDVPAPREKDYPWMSRAAWWERHRALLAIDPTAKRESQLAFVGDSITEGWDDAVWSEFFVRYRPIRLGLGGDKTQQLLFRIERGELDGLGSRVLVLLIGTNNFGLGKATPEGVARGIGAVLGAIRGKLPDCRILLLAILPRDQPHSAIRRDVAATNQLLTKLADGDRVRYLDLGSNFLETGGKIPVDLMADSLHPTPLGYRVLSSALSPVLHELLQTANSKQPETAPPR